jgi:hypothetical protein
MTFPSESSRAVRLTNPTTRFEQNYATKTPSFKFGRAPSVQIICSKCEFVAAFCERPRMPMMGDFNHALGETHRLRVSDARAV